MNKTKKKEKLGRIEKEYSIGKVQTRLKKRKFGEKWSKTTQVDWSDCAHVQKRNLAKRGQDDLSY